MQLRLMCMCQWLESVCLSPPVYSVALIVGYPTYHLSLIYILSLHVVWARTKESPVSDCSLFAFLHSFGLMSCTFVWHLFVCLNISNRVYLQLSRVIHVHAIQVCTVGTVLFCLQFTSVTYQAFWGSQQPFHLQLRQSWSQSQISFDHLIHSFVWFLHYLCWSPLITINMHGGRSLWPSAGWPKSNISC